MHLKYKSCAKYTGLTLVLHIFLIRSANGKGICTKLKYGTAEDDYMPVLVKHCCPGYAGVNTTQCYPRCDNGCPPNSQCVIPNVCECNKGYEVDETVLYYGITTVKSCRSKEFPTTGIVIGCSVLGVLVVITAFVVLVLYYRKGQNEPIVTENNPLEEMGPLEKWCQ